jgi:hypothetical protein
MTNVRDQLYHRHRFPAEIIAEAVWLDFRFPLSFRMVEDMLAYKGMRSAGGHHALATSGTLMRVRHEGAKEEP